MMVSQEKVMDAELQLKKAHEALQMAQARQDQVRRDLSSADADERKARTDVEIAKRRIAETTPVDRSRIELTDGSPVPDDRSHTELNASGQQKGYIVLSEGERSKGFVRPYRDAYRHAKCGHVTTMGRGLSETYARDPKFYSRTFCATCRGHFPVGTDGEFIWLEMDGSETEKVGT